MAQNQRIVGESVVAEFIVSGGGTYTLSGDLTAVDITWTTNEADLTALGDTYSYMKPTTKVNGATLTSMSKAENDSGTWGNLPRGTEGQLYIYPAGKTNGKPKAGFPCYMKDKPFSISKDNAVVRTATFSPQGGEYGVTVFDPDVHTYSA